MSRKRMPKSSRPGLCAKLARLNDGTPMEYREVRLMARVLALNYATADGAILQARRDG
jgi:hypothetical protein